MTDDDDDAEWIAEFDDYLCSLQQKNLDIVSRLREVEKDFADLYKKTQDTDTTKLKEWSTYAVYLLNRCMQAKQLADEGMRSRATWLLID